MAEKIHDDQGYVRGIGGAILDQPPNSALTPAILAYAWRYRRWERRTAREELHYQNSLIEGDEQ